MKITLLIIIALIASLTSLEAKDHKDYCWDKDLQHRKACDFTRSREEVVNYIKKYIPKVTDSQISAWEQSGALECMTVNGQKKYFRNAAPNLFRIDASCARIKALKDGVSLSGSERDDAINIPEIISSATGPYCIGAPKRMRVTFTLSVHADAVPAGEKVRCWLPFPRTDIPRQKDVRLLSVSEKKYQLAPETCQHSSVYMEKKAKAGQPTVFSETFEYTSYGAWFNLQEEDIKPYDTTSALYKTYTAERSQHILFTPELRQLAAELTEGETHPLKKARNIFRYITANFPWASALEYSTIDNIPMYVLKNRHGDCGQVSLLFITLCRISGIPAHFQSGLMMHPHGSNMHDWSEIYFEGIGWVPVDQSFGIPVYARNDAETWFFLGGIDSWRLVANQDYGMEMYPKKQFPRSETVDFQRGEVEWKGGNLYFDQWDYHWDIEYLN